MELNQFRDVDVVLDKANDNIIQKQFVSAGDKDGRSLTVQLTDNGVIGEIIGAALNLYWHNQASGLTDLSSFYVVDRATSVFKIDYPQNMLTPGKVIAYIQILHGGKVTHTKPFEITVQNLAGTTKGVLQSAEYTALVEALAKANEFETDIAEVTAQLAQKANEGDVRKDTSKQPINHVEFDTETKAMFTGGSVAVVGERSVGYENLKPNSVTPDKMYKHEDGVNLFDEKRVTNGFYVETAGGTITEAPSPYGGFDSFHPFITVLPNTKYHRSNLSSVTFYNASGTYISSSEAGRGVFETPSSCTMIRVSLKFAEKDAMQISKGERPRAFEKYKYTLLGLETNNHSIDKLEECKKSVNIFNKETIVMGSYMHTSGGVVNKGPSPSGINYYSDFINVDGDTTYHRNKKSSIIFFSLNKLFIDSTYVTPSTPDGYGAFTTPPNCVWIVVNGLPDEVDELQIEKGPSETPYQKYGYTLDGLNIPILEELNKSKNNLSIPFNFKDLIGSVEQGDGISIHKEAGTGLDVLELTSTTTSATKVERKFNVSEGSCVMVNLTAKANEISHDGASVKVWYLRKGVSVYEGTIYDITSTDVYKDFIYKFPVPVGIDEVNVVVYSKQNTMSIKNLEIYQQFNPKAPKNEGVRFIAHLGMMQYAPKNTLEAFSLAAKAGFYGCVINTGLTSDGYLVALHDQTIDATSDGTGDISTMTLAQAREYDYGSWFNPLYTGTQIPLLEDVLKLCARSGMHPYIRISHQFTNNDSGVFTQMYEMASRNGLLGKMSFKGFELEGLQSAFEVFGDKARYGYSNATNKASVDSMKSFPNPYVDIIYASVTEPVVKYALENGVEVETWTVNNFMTAYELMNMGVTAFTTDNLSLDGCLY